MELIRRLRLDIINKEIFIDELRVTLALSLSLIDTPSIKELNFTAMSLIEAVSKAFSRSATWIIGQNTG
jgi:hypothetical protein